MKRLLCRIFGHRWVERWNGGPAARSAPLMQCTRCHETGWKMP